MLPFSVSVAAYLLQHRCDATRAHIIPPVSTHVERGSFCVTVVSVHVHFSHLLQFVHHHFILLHSISLLLSFSIEVGSLSNFAGIAAFYNNPLILASLR